MSPLYVGEDVIYARFPRVSGDEPDVQTHTDQQQTFSPRERG